MQGEPGSLAASGFHHLSAADDIGFPWQKNAVTHGTETGAQGGDTLGHMGHRQTLFAPHLVRELLSESYARGNSTFSLISPCDPHQGHQAAAGRHGGDTLGAVLGLISGL
jgi:hypothetical protein